MLSYLLLVVLVTSSSLLLFAVLRTVQRSRDDAEYLYQVQRRIDHIANT
jgi:hypothetical protein